jgi:hypothetical protein
LDVLQNLFGVSCKNISTVLVAEIGLMVMTSIQPYRIEFMMPVESNNKEAQHKAIW